MSEQRALESACLAPEVLARYLDNTLSGEERESVEAHLASCDDCREILVVSFRALDALGAEAAPSVPCATPVTAEAAAPAPATPAEPEPGASVAPANITPMPIREDRRRVLWAIGGLLAAAAVLAVIVVTDPAWWRALTGHPPGVTRELEALVAAAGTQNRFIEPRLTGGFKHGPLRSVTRSGNPTRRLTPEITIPIIGIKTAAESGGTEQVHALGIAQIFEGTLDAAIASLERASAQAGQSSARILTDLSAAYLARWHERGDDNDAKKAANLGLRAVTADASIPEAWFNLGLAREAVGDTTGAREAWTRYLEVDTDPKSIWREEARGHLRPLPP